jgi:hypothetical protein
VHLNFNFYFFEQETNSLWKDFWTHVGWSSWSITNYDRVATKNILGLKRSRAHEFLKQDLTDVIKVLDPKGRRIQRARQMEKDLKSE